MCILFLYVYFNNEGVSANYFKITLEPSFYVLLWRLRESSFIFKLPYWAFNRIFISTTDTHSKSDPKECKICAYWHFEPPENLASLLNTFYNEFYSKLSCFSQTLQHSIPFFMRFFQIDVFVHHFKYSFESGKQWFLLWQQLIHLQQSDGWPTLAKIKFPLIYANIVFQCVWIIMDKEKLQILHVIGFSCSIIWCLIGLL